MVWRRKGIGAWMGGVRDDIGKRASRGCTWGTSRGYGYTEEGSATGDNTDRLARMRPVDKDEDRRQRQRQRKGARTGFLGF